MDHLHDWLLGLPWVVERPAMPEAPRLRWFAVDCEPLGRRQLWLMTGALGDMATDDLGVHVVLPMPDARRIVDGREGTVVAPVGDRHFLVSIHLDAIEPADHERLERALLLAYEASFA